LVIEDILRIGPHATVQFRSLFPLAIRENRLVFFNSQWVIQPIQLVSEPIQLVLWKGQQGFVRGQQEFAANQWGIAGNQPIRSVCKLVFRGREWAIERGELISMVPAPVIRRVWTMGDDGAPGADPKSD